LTFSTIGFVLHKTVKIGVDFEGAKVQRHKGTEVQWGKVVAELLCACVPLPLCAYPENIYAVRCTLYVCLLANIEVF